MFACYWTKWWITIVPIKLTPHTLHNFLKWMWLPIVDIMGIDKVMDKKMFYLKVVTIKNFSYNIKNGPKWTKTVNMKNNIK